MTSDEMGNNASRYATAEHKKGVVFEWTIREKSCTT